MKTVREEVEVLEIGRIDTHLAVDYQLQKDSIGWYFECSMKKYVMDAIAEYESEFGVTLGDYPTPSAPGDFC